MPLSVCDNDCLAAFSPHTTLGKLAHLSFVKTLLPRLGSSQFLQPSPWMFLCPQLTLPLWGSTPGCLCGRGRTLSQAARIDNSALCSLSSLHSLLHLSRCGILGAVCGCLAPPAVEGEYCPWDRELLQGQWLQHLSKEEEMGTREGTRFAPCPSLP